MSEDDRHRRADALLDAALDLPRPRRAEFLDRECADDPELRALVARLVASAETPTAADALGTGGALDAAPAVGGPTLQDLTGRCLDGRYRLRREIGRGGMGVVYDALDERLDRAVAVKVLSSGVLDDRGRERFLREARAAASLNHRNVVAVHDAGEADGRPYLVMELVEGTTLDREPPRNLDETIAVAVAICRALEHAHERGLVHRDLKPGNVMVVRRDDGAPVVKLADMGIALPRGGARITRTGAVAGTPAFMAPEQALGQTLDGRADLYALGVMLYLWTTGRLPFDGEDALAVVSQHIHAPVVPPRTFRPDLPPGLEPTILRLLAKAPEQRFPDAVAVREALAAVGRADPSESARVTIDGLARGRLVGRVSELETLRSLWRGAIDGEGVAMALISGEPGIGKTRLAREMTAAAQLDGAIVLSGGCYENEAATPYLPFLEAFRRMAGDRDDDTLRAELGDSAAEIARLAPEIESRLGPLPPRPTLAPQEERLRLFDHVARYLRRLARGRGLLFFIDDLQWADHGTVALLHYLLRQLSGSRVFFLGTYREVELDRSHALSRSLVDWHRERLAVRVRLERLDRDQTGRMLTTLLGQADVSDEFVATLHAETEGNPFFVEEIVKALIAEGDIVHEQCQWRRRTTGEVMLPQSVKAAIGRRLEQVGEACGEALRTAAVLGKTFAFGELAAVAHLSEDELLDALDEAVAAQLVTSTGGEDFAFTHDKIREVLYDELNPVRRRRLHAAIATGLEGLRERGGSVSVEDLAHHAVESGDLERGLLWSGRAAEAALGVFAWTEALEMLARAYECAECLGRTEELARIDGLRGDATIALGDVNAAAEHYERALATTADDDRRNTLRGKVAEVYVTSGDPRGLELVRLALEDLDCDRMPVETAQALLIRGRYHHLRGGLAAAGEDIRSAIDIGERHGAHEMLVRAWAYLAGTLQHQARYDESDAASRRCIEIGERERLPLGVALGCEFLSENAYMRGRWRDAVANGEREEATALEIHAGERLLWARFRALALYELGRFHDAERLIELGIEGGRATGERRLALFLEMAGARLLADRGRGDEAVSLARAALDEADETDMLAHRIAGGAYLGDLLADAGRHDDAVAAARTASELWMGRDMRGLGLVYGARLAETLVRGGAPTDEIERLLDAHREIAEDTSARHRHAQNERVRGLLHERAGRLERAGESLDAALAVFESCDSAAERMRTLADRARVFRALRRADAADDDLAERERLCAECERDRPPAGGAGT